MQLDATKVEPRAMDWFTILISNMITIFVIFFGHQLLNALREYCRNISSSLLAAETVTTTKGVMCMITYKYHMCFIEECIYIMD